MKTLGNILWFIFGGLLTGMDFCRMHMVYYNYWNSGRPAML